MKRQINEHEILTEEQYQEIAQTFYEDRKVKTAKIYNAYSEYIESLENSLEYEQDFIKKYHIKKEIKKMKKEQKRFYIPKTLTYDKCTNQEHRNYDPAIFDKSVNSSDMFVKRKTYKSN